MWPKIAGTVFPRLSGNSVKILNIWFRQQNLQKLKYDCLVSICWSNCYFDFCWNRPGVLPLICPGKFNIGKKNTVKPTLQ